jgi:hypothetical protein
MTPDPITVLRVLLCALLLPAPPAFAQDRPPATSFTMQAVKTLIPPRIDGVIEDAEWRGAARGENFIQFEPNRGEPSGLRTVVLVQYDDARLYVAFEAHDPEALIGQMTQRDAQLWNDDSVQVYIDSFHDGRSGYYFMANVLGTQADGRIGEDGTSNDDSWDAPWSSVATRTEYGYAVEVAIPFESIKYVAGPDVTWGINFARTRRRSLERSYWAGPVDHWGRMSQAGDLVGIDVPPLSRRHLLVPYAVGQVQDGRAPAGDIGLDVRYGLTPQTSVYATLNPDFATVEADQETINLTRFEVSLAEKRQFFLEGQEQFNQRIQTFYSRRITDITGGAKVLGKQGPWSFAVLTTRGDIADTPAQASYTVARIQRDVSARSTIAGMVADRRLAGRHQGSVELDANLFFTPTFGMTGQFIKSYGEFGRGSTAFFVRPSYDSSTAHAHVRYTHLGDRVADNVNAIGFILDDDRREFDSAVEKTVWPARGPAERINYTSNYSAYWGQTGVLRSWQVDENVNVDWRSKWSTEVRHREEFKRFEKNFRNRQTTLGIGYDTRSWQSVRGGVSVGHNFDADFTLWSAAANYKLTDELSAEYELQKLTLDPDPGDASTWIHVVRANHFFTPDLFARIFFQTNSAIDRRNLQAVFVYRYLPPFGTIQVAFQRGTAEFGQRSEQGNTLFVKVTTVL